MIFDYIETFYNPRRRHIPALSLAFSQFEDDWLCSQREGCSGGVSLGDEQILTEQVGSQPPAVNNFQELFKPPETTRSRH